MKNEKEKVFSLENTNFEESVFEGVYGKYRITKDDAVEVQRYRISILICGLSFCGGIFHWLFFGPSLAWLWLIAMTVGLGLALKWIHIYLRPLHRALQILWAIGCLGFGKLLINVEHILIVDYILLLKKLMICYILFNQIINHMI